MSFDQQESAQQEASESMQRRGRLLCSSKHARNGTSSGSMDPQNDLQSEEGGDSFLKFIFTSKGPPQIILWSLFYAIAIGSTITVVPSVITDRYARINYQFDGHTCSSYGADEKPDECSAASNDAMNASAVNSFVENMLTFATSPLMGSISDERGRRKLLLISSFLSILGPVMLVALQRDDSMNPAWYYASTSIKGFVSFMNIALSSMADVLPRKWRAPGFGLLTAGFFLGIAFSPLLALGLNHIQLSIFSLCLMIAMFVLALFFLPETLSREKSEEARRLRLMNIADESTCCCIFRNVKRPVVEILILNRDRLFRLVATLAFFSGMVLSADGLLIYYIQDRYGATDKEVSALLVMVGILNIFVQAFVMKPLLDCIGEKMVLVVAFFFGSVHNLTYGFGPNIDFVYAAGALGSIREMSFPTISAIKSNNVDEHEQGRIQGALYSVSSLAGALGPLFLRFVYYRTRNKTFPGPGAMFVAAAGLDVIAVGIAFILPKNKVDSNIRDDEEQRPDNNLTDASNLSAPLLDDANSL